MNRLRFPGLLLLAGLTIVACGPKGAAVTGWDEETMGQDPTANFENGVLILKSPSKSGDIDYTTAYQRFDRAATLGAGAKAHFNAGWTAEKLGDQSSAEAHYRAAFEADNAYQQAMFALANILEQEGRAAESVALYDAFLQSHPGDMEVLNELLVAQAAAGQYEGAQATAETILRGDPKNATVYRNLSGMYYAQGNYGMSQLCAEKALSLNDGDPGTYNNMAVTYLEQSDEPAAIEKLKMARKLDPNNFEANVNLGFVALNSGDYSLALDCFEKAAGADPGNVDAKLGLAVASRGVGDFARAGQLYDEILKVDPANERAYFNAATLHEKYTKDFTKALKYLDAYIDQNAGQLSPSHEVFSRKERVQQSKAAEDARKAAEAAKKKEEEERLKRNQQLLADMGTRITDMQNKMAVAAACLDEGSADEVAMVIEQAQMVVEAEDASMASDIKMLLDTYGEGVDTAFAMCQAGGGGAPTPAPEEGDGAAPAEGGDEAPAEDGAGETKGRPDGE
jgi:tetratricopeptide (TPR) repeat protein